MRGTTTTTHARTRAKIGRDHREDIAEERGDRAKDSQEQRTERQENRRRTRSDTQGAADRASGEPAGEPSCDTSSGSAAKHRHASRDTAERKNSGSGEARGYTRGARSTGHAGEQRRQFGRLLGVLLGQIGTVGQPAWRSEPRQQRPVEKRRRRTASLNDPEERQGTETEIAMRSNSSRRKMACCLIAAALTIGNLTLPGRGSRPGFATHLPDARRCRAGTDTRRQSRQSRGVDRHLRPRRTGAGRRIGSGHRPAEPSGVYSGRCRRMAPGRSGQQSQDARLSGTKDGRFRSRW